MVDPGENVPVTARLTSAFGEERLSRSHHPEERSSVMQRRRFKHMVTFPDDLGQAAERLRAEAEKLSPPERHALERKARQAEIAARIDEWLKSPGLQPPK
jgi:hypothetical protein